MTKTNNFRTDLGLRTFLGKYAATQDETWKERAHIIVDDVAGTRGGTTHALMSKEDRADLAHFIHQFMFLPGGRYIYYAGRGVPFYSNCYAFAGLEDTREEWGRIIHSASDALTSGGGIGVDYSVFRPRNTILKRTGGRASGPLALAYAVNEYGRNVRQGGSRRSAIYGSLDCSHADAADWLAAKDWAAMPIPGVSGMTYADAKRADFDFPAPLDMTNISFNYSDDWLFSVMASAGYERVFSEAAWHAATTKGDLGEVFLKNAEMALRNGDPGFSLNFFDKAEETLRNACTEFTTKDDSDVCNLGSMNMAAIPDLQSFIRVVELSSKFLVCGSIRGALPNEKIRLTREKNRRIGLGLMGVHEWLLQRGHRYEMNDDLREWMEAYRVGSERAANEHCDRFFISRPTAYRSIAPTGTIGILAGTTTGIEPIYAVAYKRRWLDGEVHRYQYVIDHAAQTVIDQTGCNPDDIETSLALAEDPERRIAFQADMQDYVDMGISSTINLPAWGTEHNNENHIEPFARLVAKYAPRLRGFTAYPDGARGGQPLVRVPYAEAVENGDAVFVENSDMQCKSGVCGV